MEYVCGSHPGMKIIAFIIFTVCSAYSLIAEQEVRNEFYAFYNGMPKLSYDEEARLLKELGYDGISQVYEKECGEKLADRITAYEKHGVRVLSVYIAAKKEPVAEDVISPLANRGGMIELNVPRLDDEILRSIRKTAEIADELSIKVVIYPHHNFAIETMPQAIELVEKVNHPNLGIMFNLCHFLKNEKAEDLEAILQKTGDKLFAVSTCGADTDGKDWKTLIQPLNQGSFPQRRLLSLLKGVGYAGPVSLQCFNVPGDKKENLQNSMRAWRELVSGNAD